MNRSFAFGMLFTLCALGCAGVTFPYKYYGLNADSYAGSLLGPEPKDDIPFESCKPTDFDKSPCVVMKTKDVLTLKLDYLETAAKLKQCEQSSD